MGWWVVRNVGNYGGGKLLVFGIVVVLRVDICLYFFLFVVRIIGVDEYIW